MKWLIVICVLCVGVLVLAGDRMLAIAQILVQSKTLEEKIYLPRCNGSWFIENQGSDDNADWVVLHCNDYSDENARNN